MLDTCPTLFHVIHLETWDNCHDFGIRHIKIWRPKHEKSNHSPGLNHQGSIVSGNARHVPNFVSCDSSWCLKLKILRQLSWFWSDKWKYCDHRLKNPIIHLICVLHPTTKHRNHYILYQAMLDKYPTLFHLISLETWNLNYIETTPTNLVRHIKKLWPKIEKSKYSPVLRPLFH